MKKTATALIILFSILYTTPSIFAYDGMVHFQGGHFTRGVEGGENNGNWANPLSDVWLSPFYLSATEVTLEQFFEYLDATGRDEQKTMTILHINRMRWGYNPDLYPELNLHEPATFVDFMDATLYCNWLSTKEGLEPVYSFDPEPPREGWPYSIQWDHGKNGYRLPTEAEWEFAAAFHFRSNRAGEFDLLDYGWTLLDAVEHPQAVAQKQAMEPGLYDMLGNVLEWCWDYYDPNYYAHAPYRNPRGPEQSNDRESEFGIHDSRVIRGMNFRTPLNLVSVFERASSNQYQHFASVGFRIARDGD